MARLSTDKERANVELILLGFLVSLILKGLLDHVYSANIEQSKGWHQILRAIWACNPAEVCVFLFALLRFMYGAYRYHEVGPKEVPWPWVIWDLSFTVILNAIHFSP